MFFLHYHAVKRTKSDSMAAIWLERFIFRWIKNLSTVTHFQKEKPHQGCLTFDKRLFLPQIKFMELTSKPLLLKWSVKITYLKLMKIALSEKKKNTVARKQRWRQDVFLSQQMDTVGIPSWTLLRSIELFFPLITTSHAKLRKMSSPWMRKKEMGLFLITALRNPERQQTVVIHSHHWRLCRLLSEGGLGYMYPAQPRSWSKGIASTAHFSPALHIPQCAFWELVELIVFEIQTCTLMKLDHSDLDIK